MDTNEKKIALDALFYEILMFNRTCGYALPFSQEERNMVLESFLVHTRNLVCFLQKKQYTDDINCSDFGVDSMEVNLPQNNGIFEINKHLSHLTQTRISGKKPEWGCSKIREEINKGIKEFITNLEQSIFPTQEGKNKNDFLKILN